MNHSLESWDEIARIIERDKEEALAYLRSREFAPRAAGARPAKPSPRRLARHPALWGAAASLLLAAGLVSLWLLRGSWRSTPMAEAGSKLLADSFLYAAAGQVESAAERGVPRGASACFTAWAAAARQLAFAGDEASAPANAPDAAVERGDPEEVRRRIGRAIQKGAFERLLSHWQEFHEKEA